MQVTRSKVFDETYQDYLAVIRQTDFLAKINSLSRLSSHSGHR